MTEPISGQPLEIILPSGQPAYYNPYSGAYTRSRSYAQRMQRNYARGISQSTARGHRAIGGRSESQLRSEREQAKYGDQLPPNYRFGIGFQQRYGFSYNYWRSLRRRFINDINARALPNAPSRYMIMNDGQRADPRVFPSDISAVKALYDGGYRDPVHDAATWEQWVEQRLLERLTALIEFQDMHNAQFGRNLYSNRTESWINYSLLAGATGPPIELWWYH